MLPPPAERTGERYSIYLKSDPLPYRDTYLYSAETEPKCCLTVFTTQVTSILTDDPISHGLLK